MQGAHADDIAATSGTGVEPKKLARVLRMLCTNHIFREVSPNIFANNRISSALDTGKPVAQIIQNAEMKHDRTNGLAALIEHCADDDMKASAYLPETLLSPVMAKSEEPTETAFNKAFNTNLPWFSWYELPGNEYIMSRFSMGMKGIQNISPGGAILHGFDWKSLPEGSLIVDVGGGIGTHTLELVRSFGHLNYIVQDTEAVVSEDFVQFWMNEYPDAIASGKVKLLPHDFLKPQPVKAPAVFLLRLVIKNWSDAYCVKILGHLRDAAGPETKLVLADSIIAHACPEDVVAESIPGYTPPARPPAPLLPNKGVAAILPYIVDMHMLAMLNGSERTAPEWQTLLKASGWKLDHVSQIPRFGSQGAKLIAVPM
ncbi:hypothetical protein NM688_g6916 [Phlebia brevispora]|uniref:Uncharacterized protein n=1 Tax=Phlebia brevispora TaxID=194682 RepID=A0ACC1SB13_9APHY|nr:hypothetical protein NM688_g6916 [Phlebia brevispora]